MVSEDSKKWYYYCNRARKYKPRGQGLRQMKTQGTSKIGQQCTAHMKVVQKASGQVSVEYCDFHIHNICLGHLPLPDSSRKSIASKLKDGVAIDKILDDIRDSVHESLNREHLISR